MSMQARLQVPATSLPPSDRLTRPEKASWQLTDTDIRLPDDQRLAPGSTLQVGGEGWYDPIKTTLDSVAAGVLLLLSLPFVLVSALIVRLTSHGPAFYTQMRLGAEVSRTLSTSSARCITTANVSLEFAGVPEATVVLHRLAGSFAKAISMSFLNSGMFSKGK